MAEPIICTLRPEDLNARRGELLPGRFLEFQLTVAPAGGPFILGVRGPEGTPEFLDQFAIL